MLFPAPTASKVANMGERKPYAAPPTTLAKMPSTGHKMKGSGMDIQRTSLRIGPNCFDLFSEVK